jgi:hypothetical protein
MHWLVHKLKSIAPECLPASPLWLDHALTKNPNWLNKASCQHPTKPPLPPSPTWFPTELNDEHNISIEYRQTPNYVVAQMYHCLALWWELLPTHHCLTLEWWLELQFEESLYQRFFQTAWTVLETASFVRLPRSPPTWEPKIVQHQ